ncbi:MAG: UDP-N-acetylmuramate--L-alanine ligase [Acidimicrobiales bacterium]
MADTVDLSFPRRIHLAGAGGAGMAAIAEVLVGMGHTVTGSDLAPSARVEHLRAIGVPVEIGHCPGNVGGAEVVAASTAIPASNPELEEAARRGLVVLRRAGILAGICALRRSVGVAGTHGKTTTSAMLAQILEGAGRQPSVILGGEMLGEGAVAPGAGGRWGEGEWLVVEADESDSTFLQLDLAAGLVTSVEEDHLDHFGGRQGLEEAFAAFAAQVTGPLVVCADDAAANALRPASKVSYGTAPDATFRVSAPTGTRWEVRSELFREEERLGWVNLRVPGAHNALNAAGALAMAMTLGLSFEEALPGLESFAGVARRFELLVERHGVTVVDEYAHNPGKLRAALATAAGMWDRVVAVFQPHRYSRTAALSEQLAEALTGADVVVVTPVYSAGEDAIPGVTAGRLAAQLRALGANEVHLVLDLDDLEPVLDGLLRPGDLCLALGAGDLSDRMRQYVKGHSHGDGHSHG